MQGSRLIILSSFLLFWGNAVAQDTQGKKHNPKELNELMVKVWQNCKIDLDNLRGYTFNETDSLYGKKFFPGMSDKVQVQDRLDYVWNVKEGYLGPSLRSINGKEVAANGKKIKITKKDYSLTWDPAVIQRYVNDRENPPKWEKWDTILDFFDDLVEGYTQPYNQRIYERFEYKPRNYRYVGFKEYEGHRVIEITYPTHVNLRSSAAIWITMLVLPDENQLVAVALSVRDNQSNRQSRTDWTLTMDNSYNNVWLPKKYSQSGTGSWGGEWSVSREFNSYAKTGVAAKFRFEDVKAKIIYDLEEPKPKP